MMSTSILYEILRIIHDCIQSNRFTQPYQKYPYGIARKSGSAIFGRVFPPLKGREVNLEVRSKGGAHSTLYDLPLQGLPHLLGDGLLHVLRNVHPICLHDDQPPFTGIQEFHFVKSISFWKLEHENSGVL